MSIILKGIDRPNMGEELVIYICSDGLVGDEKYGTLIKDAEAIQIPKDHGRIIDEREAIRGRCKVCAFNDGICGKDETICEDKEMCKYAPTILESEE